MSFDKQEMLYITRRERIMYITMVGLHHVQVSAFSWTLPLLTTPELSFPFLFPADDKSSFIIPTSTHNIDESGVYSATARKFLFSFPDSNSLFWELTFICSSSR